ncbi:MAG: hypothetical protein ACYS0G_13335, partial [Planctomycetota bacterium]
YEKWLFLVDAQTGAVLYQESQILEIDVVGNVSGMATQGVGADICEPEALEVMPYACVNIGAEVAYADEGGHFVIPNPGSSPVTVESPVRGRWFRVFNQGGPDTVLSMEVTPPGPANFVHNAANDEEFIRAEVNGYVESNVVRDFTLTYNPSYPTIWNQTEFTVNVNIDDSCNAFYDGNSINFFRAGDGCSNMANTTIVHHEYGHHLVNVGGSSQGQYGEGMSDTMGVLITDTPESGIGFHNDCDASLRTAENDLQYPCSGEIHYCGQLLSGCVWDTSNELIVTEPSDYRDILSNLAVNAILLHTGSDITPQITIDYLTLDDDDGDISNGTPHYDEINAGFSDHNMPAPPLDLLVFMFPDGVPEIINPDGGTTFRVEVSGLAAEPEPGTGLLHYSASGVGRDFVEIPMVEIEPNIYDAVFPAIACRNLLEFFVTVETTTGDLVRFPPEFEDGQIVAPFFGVSAASVDVIFEDDFETDLGWSVVTTATGGQWERGVPAVGGDRWEPHIDADGSGQCYVTGNDGSDVDDGSTTLTSPVLDATVKDPLITYWRWYYTRPVQDVFLIEVSENGGSSWVNLETVSGAEARGGWWQKSFWVADVITPTNQFRIRFIASDTGLNSIVEAGVDGVRLRSVDCEGSDCPWDCQSAPDGSVGIADLLSLLAQWGGPGACDVDGGGVGVGDLLALLANWGSCP